VFENLKIPLFVGLVVETKVEAEEGVGLVRRIGLLEPIFEEPWSAYDRSRMWLG